jgi:hypothetical protein
MVTELLYCAQSAHLLQIRKREFATAMPYRVILFQGNSSDTDWGRSFEPRLSSSEEGISNASSRRLLRRSVTGSLKRKCPMIHTGGTITGGSSTTAITYTAGGTGTLTLSVTVTNACGTSPAGTRNVTVASGPTAKLTVNGPTTITRGSSATLHVVLTGTQQWTVMWFGVGSQIVNGSFDRTVSPQTTTAYQITAVSDGSPLRAIPDRAAQV